MSKTTPVRWWRDDATRYHGRPPYVARPVEQTQWVLELLRGPIDPALLRARDYILEQLVSAATIPAEARYSIGHIRTAECPR